MHKRMDLTEGPISRTLLIFSLPVLGSTVLQSINGSINAIWVGRLLGEEALTATTNANLILFFLLGAVFGVGMSSTILVGHAIGERDVAKAKRVVGTAASFFVVTSVLMAIGGYLGSEEILRWMGTPENARPLAEAYLRVIFLSMPFLYFFAFIVMVQRGAGDAKTPFWFMSLAAVLDIILNPLLITGIGPFPQLGIAGAATSTLIAQAIGLVAMLAYLYRRKAELRIGRGEFHYFKPDNALLRIMVFKGLPMGLQMIVVSTSAIIMMSMINGYGVETAAAYGVAMQVWTYIQMPAMAISAGVSSMAAQNVGAKKWDRVERTAHSGIIINFFLTGSIVALLYVFDPLIVDLFLPGKPHAVAMAEHINNIASWSFILFGVMFVVFGVVRSTGAVTPPLIILTVSLFGVRIAFAKAFEPSLGADAIWWSFPLSMAVAMVLSLAYYRWGGWRKARMGPITPPAREVEDAPITGAGVPAIDAAVANEEAPELVDETAKAK
jgi:putative MATE family efflux protein